MKAMEDAKNGGHALHIMGVSLHQAACTATCTTSLRRSIWLSGGVEKVYVHCFLNGRDVPPKSGAGFVKELQEKCDELGNAEIATLQGRFWGMDRDKQRDRVEKGYNAVVCGEGVRDDDAVNAVGGLCRGQDDELVEPVVVCPEGVINQGDSVIFMNFRPDRAREMTWALNLPDFDGFARKKTVCPPQLRLHRAVRRDSASADRVPA
ncbi:MAG: hypothetical protein V8S72_09800 [Oscillospiraceae bacterium]